PYVELERRFHAVCEHHGLDLKALIEEGWLYLGTRDKQPLYIASAGRNGVIIDQDAADDIETFIRTHKIGFLGFDPLKSLHRVAENSNTDRAAVAAVFNATPGRPDVAIALPHPTRKRVAGQSEATAADARGASALINKVRLSRVLNVMTAQLAVNAHISEEE